MNVSRNIRDMHLKYGVHDWVDANKDKRGELLKLRLRMLNEEHTETINAYLQGDAEEVVDGLIDLIVIAAGTLDIFGVNADKAWDEVHRANMSKKVGVKPGRPNPLGLPDLLKPSGWRAPDHENNLGTLPEVMNGN